MAQTKLITEKLTKKSEALPFLVVWQSRIYRKMLCELLSHLKYGRLTLVDGDKTEVFGDDASIEATVYVEDPRFYKKIITDGSIGAGEAYFEGWWHSPNTTNVVRILAENLKTLDKVENAMSMVRLPWQFIRQHYARFRAQNTKRQAKQNIMAHYDLGNELYSRFLDDTMLYSSAIFDEHVSCLKEASELKLKRICEQLALTPADHLLEIGTGWGGMAIYAAKHYGCHVTTTTISEEQYEYAKAWIAREHLSDKITLLKKDYRDLTGQYDKLVSIEMIEAVGHKYLATYFETCNRLLKPGGALLIQSILIENERYEQYKKGTDFIQQYIFPGGALPSLSVIGHHVSTSTELKIKDVFSFGHDYARTLEKWREQFNENWAEIQQFGYNEKFRRLWNFYFHYCEGGFWQRRIDVAHLLMHKASKV